MNLVYQGGYLAQRPLLRLSGRVGHSVATAERSASAGYVGQALLLPIYALRATSGCAELCILLQNYESLACQARSRLAIKRTPKPVEPGR